MNIKKLLDEIFQIELSTKYCISVDEIEEDSMKKVHLHEYTYYYKHHKIATQYLEVTKYSFKDGKFIKSWKFKFVDASESQIRQNFLEYESFLEEYNEDLLRSLVSEENKYGLV